MTHSFSPTPLLHAKLKRYTTLLKTKGAFTNLISKQDLHAPDQCFWKRHIEDSATLEPYVRHWPGFVDMGSGAGLPGIVLAILTKKPAYLVESRLKKAHFLREVVQELDLHQVSVCHERLENLPQFQNVHFVSRAFRPLLFTLRLMRAHFREDLVYVCLKGENWRQEVTLAQKEFSFRLEVFPNVTHPKGRILRLTEISA